MPASSIQEHHDSVFSVSGFDFIEKYLHAVAIDMRQDQGVKHTISD